MVEALLALGGNLGDVQATLDQAVAVFCDGDDVRLVARSSDYRTAPWGVTNQPPFVNLALVVDTMLSPRALLDRALRVEAMFGRDRSREQRWGPRSLDIDIIVFDGLEMDEPGLTLPHPRLFERAFVLAPLAEIAPDRRIKGIAVKDALAKLDASGVEKLPPRQVPFSVGRVSEA
jgi:2-amino-4-hydroxy-6-hydroxymethyldihydropteridine diphosphokinase